MSPVLIRDGEPWWLSPDIWTVPGSDPNGSPAIPAAGQSTFVWARVQNTGESALENIQVNFYWSNPATGVLRSNSTQIGTAFAMVPGGETREVLCLTPWIPAGVNGGHECLVVEGVHPSDPLPSPLPDPFSPPIHHQVAQRNIDLVRMARSMIRSMAIQIATPKRIERLARLQLVWERNPLPKEVLASLGVEGMEFSPRADVRAGLASTPEVSCENFDPKPEAEVELGAGERRTVYLQIAAGDMSPEMYAWISVVDEGPDEGIEGGISFIVTGQEG